jgi:hypothetical protein
MALLDPMALDQVDLFAIDVKGSTLPAESQVSFELKFEDGSNQARKTWDSLARLERWGNRLVVKKSELENAAAMNWSNITVISLAVYADAAQVNLAGTVSVRNLVGTAAAGWERAINRELIDLENSDTIENNALSAIINRQAQTGLFTTWIDEDPNPSYLYGQGLALKALCLEGIWNEQGPANAAALAAEKIALFLANNQQAMGYWPRAWNASTGAVIQLAEADDTVWMGDFPWPLTGLQAYYKKTGDERVRPAIQNALEFIRLLINEQGQLFTRNINTQATVEVKSNEAYAAVMLALLESDEDELVDKLWNYIDANAWDESLGMWQEGRESQRVVLFANAWLAPLQVMREQRGKGGDSRDAFNALSAVGKALHTCGPGSPCGLDGVVPLATWYEGTLSYIAAGGPGSMELFGDLINFINEDGTVPSYNDNIGSMAGIWAVDWSSLDGTTWLYYAASGNTPFHITDGTPVTLD